MGFLVEANSTEVTRSLPRDYSNSILSECFVATLLKSDVMLYSLFSEDTASFNGRATTLAFPFSSLAVAIFLVFFR